jgi:hypothetical protein
MRGSRKERGSVVALVTGSFTSLSKKEGTACTRENFSSSRTRHSRLSTAKLAKTPGKSEIAVKLDGSSDECLTVHTALLIMFEICPMSDVDSRNALQRKLHPRPRLHCLQ